MSVLFDKRVEKAIHNIWFDIHSGKREESLALLREAANMGDGDAYYFLGQCYMGKDYVDPAVGMPEDRKFAFECFDVSLGLGSAVGMFGTMLAEGYEPPRGTFASQILWDTVYEKAAEGQVFCKYLIASAYDSCKVADFWNILPENSEKYRRLQYEWAARAASLYKECMLDGLGIAVHRLTDILTSGRYGAPIQRRMAEQYRRMGAAMGITFF